MEKGGSREHGENRRTAKTQGDGTPGLSAGTRTSHVPLAETRSKPFSITFDLDVMQCMLFIIAMATRVWRLESPKAVVFDEVYFGRHASLYLERIFFFDTHPPLGKMLISLAGYLAGYDGEFNFDRIGSGYLPSVPVWHMRLLPALCGSLVVPIAYQIVVELSFSRCTAALAASLILLDNALLTQSRFMLMEGPLLFFISLAILSYLKFKDINNRCQFSASWWCWLVLLGTSMTCAISVKYVAVFTALLLLVLLARDYWRMIAKVTITDVQLLQHLIARVSLLVVWPLILYILIFYVHLNILIKAGPHDDVMTSAFQASLEGGLASITKGQPLHVAYGSQITLRHSHSNPCWLHSHSQLYPVRYSGGRGSSHQQQVTCYNFKDINNWWIVKDPAKNSLVIEEPVRPVKDGDIIQLVHGISGRALNSHDVAAPMSPQHQEVSCYIDYNMSFPAENLWRLEIVKKEMEGETWKTIQSHVRLIHVNSSQALKISGKQLPEWGFQQLEVVTDKFHDHEATIWNVEEHRYTRSKDQEQRQLELSSAEMIPLEPTQLSFLTKFWELQTKMLQSKYDTDMEHKYSSSPLEWPLTSRNIAYWLSPSSNAQIHLLGNALIWYTATGSLVVYVLLLTFHLIRRRRACWDITQGCWKQYVDVGELLLAGYMLHYFPYFVTDKTLFLHNYLPALFFKVILLATVVEHIYTLIRSLALRAVYVMFIVAWLAVVIEVFRTFSVVSYGNSPLTTQDIKHLRWQESWDFILH